MQKEVATPGPGQGHPTFLGRTASILLIGVRRISVTYGGSRQAPKGITWKSLQSYKMKLLIHVKILFGSCLGASRKGQSFAFALAGLDLFGCFDDCLS